MTKRIPLLLPFLALLFSGCEFIDAGINAERIRGSGKVVQEKREVSGFDRVRLATTGDLNLHQGDRESLTIEAEDNIMPRIVTDVEGGTLVIRTERGVSLSPTVPIRYELEVKDLNGLELSGSGGIRAGAIRSRDFGIHLSGSGEVRVDELSADTLNGGISGSGDIEVSGKVTSQKLRISGSGDYDCGNLQSRSADISVSGSGNSKVWAEDALTVHVSGSGDVSYYGNPQIEKHVSGSGKVRKLGARP